MIFVIFYTIVLALICIRINKIQIGGISMQAYCLKCREKREISDPQSVTLKNGRPATQGKCPNCGTKIFRIGKS